MRVARIAALLCTLVACREELADVDGIFDDGTPQVHCAANLDRTALGSEASIDTALDRAAARAEIVHLYAHHPGETVSLATIEYVLAGAQSRGLAFVQYRDLAAGRGAGPALALSFDDTSIAAWVGILPLLARYGAKVTFFISRYEFLDAVDRAGLHALADAGHDIEAHSVRHLRAPQYVEERGLEAYLDDEAQPSIDGLSGEGFDIVAYAYPFGARSDELDRALLGRVKTVRSVAFAWSDGVSSPCPR